MLIEHVGAILVRFAPGRALDFDPGARWSGAVDTVEVLGDDAFQPALFTLGKQTKSICEGLREVEIPGAGALDEMSEAPFTIEEGHNAEVIPVEEHEIKSPKREVVFDTLMHYAMQ
jgi:hypothetical protein